MKGNYLSGDDFKILALGIPGGLGDPNTLPILQGKVMQNEMPTIYVCEDKMCKMHTTDWEKAKALLDDFERYEL